MNEILPDEQFLPAAQYIVAQAKKSIFISTFKLEINTTTRGVRLKKLIDSLVKKSASGVDVRLLINEPNSRGYIPPANAKAITFLRPSKIKIRQLPRNRVCHAKVLIVDNEIAICGSHNLSVKSCHYNFELSCLLTEDQPVQLLTTSYKRAWDVSK